MAKAELYDNTGKKNGNIELNDKVFGVKSKMAVIHQVYVALMANKREPWAHTKDKGEVRGGGKKPWKQKGTGRARHGSIRSPIWRGGGVTFGPLKIRNYKQKINKKMNQAAVRMCLSDKVFTNKLVVVENLPKDGKTKVATVLRRALPGDKKSTLWLTAVKDDMLKRALSNAVKSDIRLASEVNVIDLLHHQYVIANREAVEVLEKRLLNNKNKVKN